MLQVEDTVLVIIDVQGKLAKVMHDSKELLANIETLIQGASLLGIPIIWMEQYPKGLGPTADEVKQHLTENQPIAKKVFSACQSEDFQAEVKRLERKSLLVTGIEAHICVYQTVHELLMENKEVEVVVDAISSRTLENKAIAIEKMTALGAAVTSVEMALFELMQSADHPQFKEISALIK